MNRNILDNNGDSFERLIVSSLEKQFPKAIVLHSIWAYSEFLGKPTQIDIVMIDEKGLYFIEAKNWKNWIKGNFADLFWYGKASGKNQLKVFSPVRQNIIHMRALRNCMRNEGVEPISGTSIVVLPDVAQIRSDCKEVINFSLLETMIMKNNLRCKDTVDVVSYRDAILNVNERYRK